MQYALWALVALRLLLPVPLAGSPISVMNVVESPARGLSQTDLPSLGEQPRFSSEIQRQSLEREEHSSAVSQASATSPEGTAHILNGALPSSKVTSGSPAPSKGRIDIYEILFVVWAIGAATLGLCFLVSNLRFGWELKKRRCRMEPEGFPLPVYLAEKLPSPCLFGFLRPAVYLTPESLKTEERKKHVLLHEYTHFRHGDLVWGLVRGICLSLHWFNPLVWAAALCSKTDCELACDEGAVQKLGPERRLDYGRTLVDLISTQPTPGELLCTATTMTSGKRAIQNRIANLTKKPRRLVVPLVAVLLAMCLTAGCTFTGAQELSSSAGSVRGNSESSLLEEGKETATELEADLEALFEEGALTLCWCSETGEGQSVQVLGEGLQQDFENLIPAYSWERETEVPKLPEPAEQLLLSNAKGNNFLLGYRESGLVYWESDGEGSWYSARAKNSEQEEFFGEALWEDLYSPLGTEVASSEIFLQEDGSDRFELAQQYASRIKEKFLSQLSFLLGKNGRAKDFEVYGCGISEFPVNDDSTFVFTVQVALKPWEGTSPIEGYEMGTGRYEGYYLYNVKCLMKRQGGIWRCLLKTQTANNYSLLESFLEIEAELLQVPETESYGMLVRETFESPEPDYPLPPAKNMEEGAFSSEAAGVVSKDGIKMTFQDVIALSEKDDNITWEDLEPYECEKVTAAYNTTITRNRYPLADPDWFLEVEEQVSDSSISKVQLYVYRGGAMDREDLRTGDVEGFIQTWLEVKEKNGYTQPGPDGQESQRTGIYTVSIPVEKGERAQDTAERFLEEWFQTWNDNIEPGHDDQIVDYVIRHVEIEEEGEDAFVFGVGYSLLPLHGNSMYLWAGNTKPDPDQEGWLSMNRTGILKQVDGFWKIHDFGTGEMLPLWKALD